jgi:hypothetical protein
MKIIGLLFFCLLVTTTAHAFTIDAKALARYDNSYAKCETKYPDMRGHRDEAYLNLWRSADDKKAQGQMEATRKSAAYKSEKQTIVKAQEKSASTDMSSTLMQECQGLWNETQKMKKPKR